MIRKDISNSVHKSSKISKDQEEHLKLYKIHTLNKARRLNATNFKFPVSGKINTRSQQRYFSPLTQAFVEKKGSSEKLWRELVLL